MGACRAGRGHRRVGAFGAEHDGNHARGHIADQHGDEKGADPLGPLGIHGVSGNLQHVQAAQAAAGQDAHPAGIAFIDNQAGVFHGHARGRDGIGDKGFHALGFLAGHKILRIESFHLARNFRVVGRGVEARDFTHTGFAGAQRRPGLLHADAQRCDQAHTGDNNPSFQTRPP